MSSLRLGCALGWLLLTGCRRHCMTFDETILVDPDGVLDEAGREAIEGAHAAFAAAVAVDGVCVDAIVVAPDLTEDGITVAGGYLPLKRRIELNATYAEDFGVTLTHELCHALDVQLGLSVAHPELFDDAHATDTLNETLYADPMARSSERFATLCEYGPRQPALTAAFEELGLASPQDTFLREEVYPAFADPPVSVGEPLGWEEPVGLPAVEKGERLRDVTATGGLLAVRAETDGALGMRVRVLDPETLSWEAEAVLREERGATRFLTGIGETDPTLVTGWATGAPRLYRWEEGGLVALGEPFAALAGDPDTAFTVDGDRAWWQTWGDGQPLQTGLLTTGETAPYEPAGELALYPPSVRLPEGPAAMRSLAWPPWREWDRLDEGGVAPLDVPLGVTPVGTLADGTVVGRMAWEDSDENPCVGVVLRDPAGAWSFPGDTACDPSAPAVLAGAVYRVALDGESVVLTRAGGP